MKRILQAFLFMVLSATAMRAQIGQVAPDFEVVSIDGDTIRLYQDILDKGLIAVIDASTTWCGPCWSLHSSHALRDLYEKHGPGGSDQLRVVFYEADANTTLADLQGTGSNTQGNWIDGTPYPIVNESPLSLSGSVWWPQGYPTVSIINPNTKKIVADTWDKTSYESQKQAIETATGITLQVVGTKEHAAAGDLELFPNPAINEVTVSLKDISGTPEVMIFDLLGQKVKELVMTGNIETIPVSGLKPGTYLLRVHTGQREMTKQLMIVRP